MNQAADLAQARADALERFLTPKRLEATQAFAPENDKLDVIRTGVLSLDVALGVGGLPRGRIVELYGPEAGGKTTLALTAAAEAQNAGYNVGLVDAEHAIDPTWAMRLGVDLDHLAFCQPGHGEEGLGMVRAMVNSAAFALVIVDSAAALTPLRELQGSIGDDHAGLQARMLSQALRLLHGEAQRTRTSIIFLNQVREHPGVSVTNPEYTPGGRALKFYSSVRLEVRSHDDQKLTHGHEVIGQRISVTVKKNKVAASPMAQADFDLIYADGIDRDALLLTYGVQFGVLSTGSTITEVASGERVAVGRSAFSVALDTRPGLRERLTEAVYAELLNTDGQAEALGAALDRART